MVIFIIITFLFHFYPINKRGYSTVSDTLFLTIEIYKKSLKIPKGVIRIRKSKKDRQHNGQKKKDKRTNNDLQSITHNTKDQVTLIQLKTGGELGCFGRVNSPIFTAFFSFYDLRTSWIAFLFVEKPDYM
jgi:hypothetical protein